MSILLTKLSDSIIESKRLINKVLGFGRGDVRTGYQLSTPGVEGRPIDKTNVVYADTSSKGTNVILGFIEESQEIEKGEVIIYSRNESGEVQNTILLKQDGTIEIGGNADNMVRFSPLSQGIKQADLDINAELVKIAAGIAAGGGSYSPTPISTDISGSKIDEITTSG